MSISDEGRHRPAMPAAAAPAIQAAPGAGAASAPPGPETAAPASVAAPVPAAARPAELGGPKGLEPTRYGDWERDGRCVDF
jgi:hypothetical protein